MRARDIAGYAAVAGASAFLTLALQRNWPSRARALPRQLPPPLIAPPSPTAQSPAPTEPTAPDRAQRSPSPLHLSWQGWKAIFWRTYDGIFEDRLLAIAAGVVFYGLLAVFPAITALVSCYGLFANPRTIADNLQSLAMMLPEGSFNIVQDQIARVVSNGQTGLGVTFMFGLALALWSANAGIKAEMDALNVVYGEKEKRGFFALNALSLTLTTCAIVMLLVMVGAVIALPLLVSAIGMADDSKFIMGAVRWPLLMCALLLALSVLYRFGPSRPGAHWQWISVGACTATLLWLAGSYLLSWYLSSFANYNATYGSLGAAIGLMMWMWMSAIVVLFGAELNANIARQTGIEPAAGPPPPMGAPGTAPA